VSLIAYPPLLKKSQRDLDSNRALPDLSDPSRTGRWFLLYAD